MCPTHRYFLLLVAALALTATATAAAGGGPGAHDRSFSENGEVRVNLAPGGCSDGSDRCSDFAEAVATDSRGRSVVSGNAGTNDDGKTGIARLKPSGKLDRSFAGDGTKRIDGAFGGKFLAIDSHDRVLVGSDSGSQGIARLTAAGKLDRSFGENGYVAGIRGPFALDSEDRVVVALRQPPADSGGGSVTLRRYTASGQPDPSFDPELASFGDPDSYDSFPTRIAIDSKDRAVVSGLRSNLEVQSYVGALARFRADGELDTGFGTDGTTLGTLNGSLVLDDGDRIVLGEGSFGDGGYIERYERSGTPDVSFGKHGRVRTGTKNHGFEVYAVAIDGRGRVIAAGDGSASDGTVARYKANGKPDRSFAHGGKADASFEEPTAVTVDAKQRIVTAGRHFPKGGGSADFAIARYLGK